MADWRNKVDPALRDYLEVQVRETNLHKNAYNAAKNQANAQLWIAVAVLSKQLFTINMKLNVLEDALREINSKVMSVKETTIYREEKVEVPKVIEVVKEIKAKTEKKEVKKTPKPKIVKKVKKGNIKKSLKRF